jgi:hypothetical protein
VGFTKECLDGTLELYFKIKISETKNIYREMNLNIYQYKLMDMMKDMSNTHTDQVIKSLLDMWITKLVIDDIAINKLVI